MFIKTEETDKDFSHGTKIGVHLKNLNGRKIPSMKKKILY